MLPEFVSMLLVAEGSTDYQIDRESVAQVLCPMVLFGILVPYLCIPFRNCTQILLENSIRKLKTI